MSHEHREFRRHRALILGRGLERPRSRAAERFVVDDFVIVTGGETISGAENFKTWIKGFLAKLTDLHLEVMESFQNSDGSRVTSRFLLTGNLGTEPDQQEIAMTGTAVGPARGRQLLTN